MKTNMKNNLLIIRKIITLYGLCRIGILTHFETQIKTNFYSTLQICLNQNIQCICVTMWGPLPCLEFTQHSI